MPALEYQRKSHILGSLWPWLGLVALCIVLFFWRLDAYTLFDRTETETAEVTRQMLVSGDWITPVFNGIRYFDKPVLLYWLMGIGFATFGVNEWTVRLPSAVFATLLVLGTYGFVLRLHGQRPALLAAAMLAVSPFALGLGRTGVTDMGLACFIAGALYGWYWSFSQGGRLGYWFGFFALAGAMLMKGPIGVLLPGLTILAFLFWTGQGQRLKELPWLGGVGLFLALCLPWYVLVTQANGVQFLQTFFFHHNLNRFVNVVDNQPGPWYYYLIFAPAGFLPWVALLPVNLSALWQTRWWTRRYWQDRSPVEQLPLFLWLWFAVVFVIVSAASTKLPHYILPAVPAMALLCGLHWDAQMRKPTAGLRWCLAALAAVLTLLAVALVIAPSQINDPALPQLRQVIEGTGLPWVLAALVGFAALATLVALVRLQLEWAWTANLLAATLLYAGLINGLLPALEPLVHGSLLQMAGRLRQEVRPGDVPATFGVYAPSLNFYGALDRIPVFEKSPQVRYQMAQPHRLLLLTTDARLSEHKMDLSAYPLVATAGIYKLYDIPPRSRLRYTNSSASGGN